MTIGIFQVAKDKSRMDPPSVCMRKGGGGIGVAITGEEVEECGGEK